MVSFERAFKKLSEAHVFHSDQSINEDTVHSQSRKKIVFLSRLNQLSSLACCSKMVRAAKMGMVLFERAYEKLSEACVFHSNFKKMKIQCILKV